jgi:hypothetical protein
MYGNMDLAKQRYFRKKEILDRQKILRQQQFLNQNYNSVKRDLKVREVLEDMSSMGSIMKEEILEDRLKRPERFIPIKEATKENNRNNGLFCLGILAQNLERMGITTEIEKNVPETEESQNESNTILQFIMNGMIEKKKFNLHFDLGEGRNKQLLYNQKERENFNDKVRKKLSLEYKIPEEKIIITNPPSVKYQLQVIFQKDDFNNENIDFNTFKQNCMNDKDFQELSKLKEVHKSLVMEGCRLNSNMLDSRGNRKDGWGVNEKRGGFNYIPPTKGWIGYGLKVWGKYDNGNNDWLSYNGNKNEWAIAYHGIGSKLGFSVGQAAHNIIKGGFKAGSGQAFQNYDDCMHPGQKVGVGVYCSPDPNVMEEYASYSIINGVNGKNYMMGFMMRVKPDKIRFSAQQKDYWVLNGTTDEMRPYRIMIKEC